MYVAGKNFLTTQKKQLNSNSKAASPQQWKKDFPLGVGAPPPPPMALFFQTLLYREPVKNYLADFVR